MNSYHIQKRLSALFSNYNYELRNTYVFKWESDYFAISKSSYIVEIEIKISKADFKNDFKKEAQRGVLKHNYLIDDSKILKPHKFFFAFPKGLINHEDIPKQYGIIEIEGLNVEVKRNAKFLHRTDLMNNNHFLKQLLNKFYYRNIDLRIEMNLRDYDLKYKQKRIDKKSY